MNKNPIKALFFDLDHTLWDFEKNSALTFKQLFTTFDINLSLDDFLAVYIPNNNAYWKLYREGKIEKEAMRYERLKSVFNTLNYKATDALIDNLADAYIQGLPKYNALFNGAIDVLAALKLRYSLHIITNGFKEVQHLKMRNSGLLPFFETITDSSSVGTKKPDPTIFNHALKVAQVHPHQALMIGDSLEADIEGALNVGMQAVHFTPVAECNPAHYHEITQLQQLLQIL
ncbi:MAG: YjjG family noncanonical pyrimidine nucleotidase [Flavobacteriaceae bacterium]|nr:YjjG family noncanonical pyrimidine nucleotidase [Flavobacteriaceae bacterium]